MIVMSTNDGHGYSWMAKKEQGRRVIENGLALLIWKHHANNKLRYIVINPCVAAAHTKAAHHVHEASRNLFVTTFIHDKQNESIAKLYVETTSLYTYLNDSYDSSEQR